MGLILGLGLLLAGSEALVRAGSKLALLLGLPPLLVGMVLIGCGTSLPELLVSLDAARSGSGALALGNVIGSNSFNIAVILGLSALLKPMRAERPLLRSHMPALLATSLLLGALLLDDRLSRPEGLLLLALFGAVGVYALGKARREPDATAAPGKPEWRGRRALLAGLVALAGLAITLFGAHLFLGQAVTVGRSLGLPEHLIGTWILAPGTSLPELSVSVIAALRNRSDLALGNVIGSNLFNILFILGLTASAIPLAGGSALLPDVLQMVGFTALLTLFVITGMRLQRWEGAALLLLYFAIQVLCAP